MTNADQTFVFTIETIRDYNVYKGLKIASLGALYIVCFHISQNKEKILLQTEEHACPKLTNSQVIKLSTVQCYRIILAVARSPHSFSITITIGGKERIAHKTEYGMSSNLHINSHKSIHWKFGQLTIVISNI